MKAFPHHHVTTYDYDNRHTHGMDMRDYFAAKAMQSLVVVGHLTEETISRVAYKYADCMMKAREE